MGADLLLTALLFLTPVFVFIAGVLLTLLVRSYGSNESVRPNSDGQLLARFSAFGTLIVVGALALQGIALAGIALFQGNSHFLGTWSLNSKPILLCMLLIGSASLTAWFVSRNVFRWAGSLAVSASCFLCAWLLITFTRW